MTRHIHSPHPDGASGQADPWTPHAHDPNPAPPHDDTTIAVETPTGERLVYGPARLRSLPQSIVTDCYIISTGHGTSGPFTFAGPALATLVRDCRLDPWSSVIAVGGDGFGTRLAADEIGMAGEGGPILLALQRDGEDLTRASGLVRLIVPAEKDDALKQVKWLSALRFVR